MFDWEIIPPITGDWFDPNVKRKALKFGDEATLEDFIQYMNQIELKFSYMVDNQRIQTSKFFIASNSAEVKIELVKMFPSAVTIHGVQERVSTEGMLLAFIDWLLLSESSLIINHYTSSFATEASVRRQVPLLGMYNHVLIHNNDNRLPYCGNMQFLRVRNSDDVNLWSTFS